MSGKQFDINAQGYSRVNAIGQLNAEHVDFGDRFIGQQRVAVIGLDPIVPEHVAAKWIDRTALQAELLGRIEAQAKLIELVAVGGFGKSLLATWLFHKVKDGFDRSLWLNFCKVPTFNEFARWVLQEIGSPINDPRVTDEVLIKNLIHRLTEKRCLVVLDQLEAVQEAQDVESFGEFLLEWQQRGYKSVVVITTRSSIVVATEASYRLNLAGFTEVEGTDFLGRQGIGAEEEGAMGDLVRLAQGHPLLLRLAVSWLRQEAEGKIDRVGLDFFAGLFQKYWGDAEAKVEEIFTKLFEDLPERLQRLLLGVVVYRDAFGLEMARGMLVDVELEDLRSLVDAGFLLVRGDRWLLHPLMGRLVRQVLVATYKEQESHQRAINYFLLNLKSEVSSIEDCTEHLEVFHHWCELGKYTLANQIMDSCVNFLRLRGCYRQLLSIYERLTQIWSISQPDDNKEKKILGWAWQKSGDLYSSLGQYSAAINAYKKAQILFEQLDSIIDKVAPLSGLGNVFYATGKYQMAIDFHQQSLAITQEIGNRNDEAASLVNLGNAFDAIGEYQRAIDFHQQSLAITQEISDRNGEAASFGNLGCAFYAIGEYQRAIYFHQKSLAIKQEIGDRNGEANSLLGLGNAFHEIGEYQRAIYFHQRSLAITQEIGDRNGEASSLISLGCTFYLIGEYQRAKDLHKQSLAITHEIGDRNGESTSFVNLGTAFYLVGEYQRAIGFYQQSLAIKQGIGNRNGEAKSLIGLGNAFYSIGEYQRAINFYQQSLVIKREIGNRNGEAGSLLGLGNAFYSIGEYQRAINFYQQSLAITQEIGDRNGEAGSLLGLGNAFYSIREYQRAINFYQQSLVIKQEIGNRNGEAGSLFGLGNAFYSMGEYQRAINFYQQFLVIMQEISNCNGEAGSLIGLGNAFYSMGEYQRAISFYQQSLIITQEISNSNGEADSLIGLGNAFHAIGEYQRAINFHQQSLAITQKIGDRNSEATSLISLGCAFHLIGEYQRAKDFHQQSLAVTQEIGDRNGEARSCHSLSLIYQQQGKFRQSRNYRHQAYRIWQELQLPLAALPFSDFQKRMVQNLGEDWIEQLIQSEQKLAWFLDSSGLIIFIIRWLFSPIRWIQKRL